MDGRDGTRALDTDDCDERKTSPKAPCAVLCLSLSDGCEVSRG